MSISCAASRGRLGLSTSPSPSRVSRPLIAGCARGRSGAVPTHPPLTAVQCCFSGAWGGLEQAAARQAAAMAGAGFRSLALCRPGTPLERALAAAGVATLAVSARDYWAPRAVARLRAFVVREGVDLLHAHRGTDLWLLEQATLGLAHRPRLFWTSHMFFRRTDKRDPLHRWLYRRLDRAIALTEIARQVLLDRLPLQAEQVVVIPNGVDLEAFPTGNARALARARARALFGVDEQTPVLGIVGRLDAKKGQREAIAALAAVRAHLPAARLVLVGGESLGHSGEEGVLRELASGLGVAEAVDFLGHRDDVAGLLPGFDLFLLPSHGEAFGFALLEAMAAGVPIVAADAASPPEILDGGRAGVLVPPRNPPALASAILALLADGERRAALTAAALARVRDCYEFGAVVGRTAALYREVCAAPGALHGSRRER